MALRNRPRTVPSQSRAKAGTDVGHGSQSSRILFLLLSSSSSVRLLLVWLDRPCCCKSWLFFDVRGHGETCRRSVPGEYRVEGEENIRVCGFGTSKI